MRERRRVTVEFLPIGDAMFKQIEPLLTETDWEKFDGYTPTFAHPNLSERELRFLLGAALQALLHAPVPICEFPEDSEYRGQGMGEPDGSAGERSPTPERDRGFLSSGCC